ncbi:MAG: glycine zipper family protein [Candidatus Kaiserbacteria bacterium]|nr:glycine zipper family protein [Candidatus Kaiserbacteria bacterium]
MKIMKVFALIAIVSLFVLTGCVTAPIGPLSITMPAPGKPLQMFQAEDKECREWALQQIGGQDAVDAANQRSAGHAIVGTLIGVAVGALIGGGVGDAGAGAAIGAGAGLAGGSASGANSAAYSSSTLQRLYDNAYLQCMYSKGNQVPGQLR